GRPDSAAQPRPDHSATPDPVGVAGPRTRSVATARADRDHPQRAAGRGVRVGAHQHAARLRVPLDVHVVADAVAGARVIDPVLARHRLEHPVVVGVLEVELGDVVVHVLDRAVDAHPRHVELLELHASHRPGGVLEQRLIDPQPDWGARLELAVHEVLLEDLEGQVRHSATTTSPHLAVAWDGVASISTNSPTGAGALNASRASLTSPPARSIASTSAVARMPGCALPSGPW